MTTETIQLDYFDILFAGIIILGLVILLAYYRPGGDPLVGYRFRSASDSTLSDRLCFAILV